MSTPQVRGIAGLLNGILSTKPTPAALAPKPKSKAHTIPLSNAPAPSAPKSMIAVRRGRPPGHSAAVLKEKVTLRITSVLIAEYRDWTWKARCQLSDLVERALADYRESRWRPR
jgi:hypothetical protein